MKALSIRQPWADLIIQGKKTIELRNWKVNHRGLLAVHASQSIDERGYRANGIEPQNLSTGVLIGTVELIDIISLDEATYNALNQEHLSNENFKPPVYGWKFSNPHMLEKPIPFTGRMGIFNIPNELIPSTELLQKGEALIDSEITLDSRLPFELQVKFDPGMNKSSPKQNNNTSYRLALFQRPIAPQSSQPEFVQIVPPQRRLVCELGGTALKAIADAVLEALRLNGYAATDLGIKRRAPFQLTEESGVRLALIFLAVKPISKISRIEEISRGIRTMTSEELYYWFAKCTSGASSDKAQKALRLLLADE